MICVYVARIKKIVTPLSKINCHVLAEALSQILALFLNKEKLLNFLNFLLRIFFEFEFHRLCLFGSGEIVKLHIVIGAKS